MRDRCEKIILYVSPCAMQNIPQIIADYLDKQHCDIEFVVDNRRCIL